MMEEADAVAMEIERLLERAGHGVGEMARQRAQQKAQAMHEAARESQQHARDARARYRAELAAARAQVAWVGDSRWWEQAQAAEIVETWSTAEQWRESEPEFAAISTRMRSEMLERFGVDPSAGSRQKTEPTVTQEVAGREPERTSAETGGGRGREVEAALIELRESRHLEAMAAQPGIVETVGRGGPSGAPQARRSRGHGEQGQERERGR
jgi:hypothetical protein